VRTARIIRPTSALISFIFLSQCRPYVSQFVSQPVSQRQHAKPGRINWSDLSDSPGSTSRQPYNGTRQREPPGMWPAGPFGPWGAGAIPQIKQAEYLMKSIGSSTTADLPIAVPSFGGACTTESAWNAHSPLFRLPLSLASFHFGRLPWVDGHFRGSRGDGALVTGALSRSRSAILLGGSVLQPKLRESRKHPACSPQTTACLFAKTSVAVSPQSALCSDALSAATLRRRFGSRPGCWWALREPDQYPQLKLHLRRRSAQARWLG
jgi:hypothetical protein